MSCTATTTAVSSQRLLATRKQPDSDPTFKQFTLRLDSSIHPTPTSPRTEMVPAPHRRPPIARLPVELLSDIFLLGAHAPDEDSQIREDDISPCLSSSSTSPDVFAAVCRHWRAVAIGTPQLWTRICVTIGDIVYSRRGETFASVLRAVARSGKCPLDIFIDARDPDWDFSEADSVGAVISPYIDELYDYAHPFRIEHMHHVLNILLPHVRRFRSLAILTDRWAPMQTALDCLSLEPSAFVSTPRPLPANLPYLESLVLMRCNEFVSYHSEFTPADRKGPSHLPFSALLRDGSNEPVLPRLKKLVLSGVHIEWSTLPRLLPSPTGRAPPALESLELSYHCRDVRPSEREFRKLLECCSKLRNMTVRVSGPHIPHSCDSPCDEEPVPLPGLETVALAYDDAYASASIVDTIDAPHLRYLRLEDASCPGHEDQVDAEPLLQAVADCGLARVEKLSLSRVDASAEAFEALYETLPGLRALDVSQMFLLGGRTLAPTVEVAFSGTATMVPVCVDEELVANKLAAAPH